MRILFVSARPPLPSRRGDQARLAGWLRALAPRHELSVLALGTPGTASSPWSELAAGELVKHGVVQMLGGLFDAARGRPLQVAVHRSGPLASAVARAMDESRPDVIVVMLSRMAWVMDELVGDSGSPPVVIDLVDSLALNLRRRAARQPLLAPLLRLEARRMARWDARVVSRAAAAAVVSSDDRHAIVGGDASMAKKIEVIPFGLALPAALPLASLARPVVLLSGNLGYFPTVDAARVFARDVWSHVLAARPDAEWWLAGARPARAIRALSAKPGVRVIADPPDLRSILRQAALSIAPLRSGSGTPIKVLEAMREGVPILTTPRGQQGLEGVPGAALAIADSAGDQVAQILRLLDDAAARRRLAEAAFGWLQTRHDLQVVAGQFQRLLRAARDR